MRLKGLPRRLSGERFNDGFHAAAPFIVSFLMSRGFWYCLELDFFRAANNALFRRARGSWSASHNRKPPRKALTLSPPRHPSGSVFSFLTLPPPRTTSSR